ncbi:MAG: hypothetical protein LUQ65_04210 [Candidatus Helarchaeota archaeon]|nr:hypothetical protein [Candidatus Helarchaeota archaeon]
MTATINLISFYCDNLLLKYAKGTYLNMQRITIYDQRQGDVGHDVLEAVIRENGDLALEGYNFGDQADELWSDSDRVFYTIIKAENVPKVLDKLISERFKKATAFETWLKELTARIGPVKDRTDPMVLLWLLKERFEKDRIFSTWLEKNKIPHDLLHKD